jgi:aspartate carbamoyltransferase catalytic subunit
MKHLLSISDLSKPDAISILDTATELARVSDGAVKKLRIPLALVSPLRQQRNDFQQM